MIRDSWFLNIRGVQESDAGKYICQLNTERPISISGTLSVVGKVFFIFFFIFIVQAEKVIAKLRYVYVSLVVVLCCSTSWLTECVFGSLRNIFNLYESRSAHGTDDWTGTIFSKSNVYSSISQCRRVSDRDPEDI